MNTMADANVRRVNLLPEWYRQQQRDRKSLRTRLLLMLALGAVMVGWIAGGQAHLRTLRTQRDQLAREASLTRDLSGDLRRREAEVAKLRHLQLAVRELGNTVPMSAVLQQVQNNMTPGMALSRFTIDVRSEPVKGSGNIGDLQHPPRYHDVANLTVVGIGPNDVQIAQLIGKLSANPLFGDLSLNYTRTEVLNNYAVRRFEIQMHVDLDRLAAEAPADPATQPAVKQLTEADHAF